MRLAWIDHILSFIRILISDDARKSADPIDKLLRGRTKKALQANMLSAKVALSEKSRLQDLHAEFDAALKDAGASPDMLQRFHLCLSELGENAFKHGCKHTDDHVQFELRIGTATTELSINQPSALDPRITSLRHARSDEWKTSINELTKFGGLMNAYTNASELRIHDSSTLVAVFENQTSLVAATQSGSPETVSPVDGESYVLVNLVGQIDASNGKVFREAFDSLRETTLILDFTGIKLFTSSGVRDLFYLKDSLSESQVRIVLCGMNAQTTQMFNAAYLDDVFPVFTNAEAAVAFTLDANENSKS